MELEILSARGLTSTVYRLENGLVCKLPASPPSQWLVEKIKHCFAVEKRLLEYLGDYLGIVKYHGTKTINGKEGFLLDEANCGEIQSYIDSDREITDNQRREWSLQLAKAVAYVHKKGIIHMNLSTFNVLVHDTGQAVNIILVDFGGSHCAELGLSGGLLPDHPYLDPQLTDFFSFKTDIFSLGVMFYFIMTSHLPFRERAGPNNREKLLDYGDRVREMYIQGKFPDLSDVIFGDVIAGCCLERRFETASDVVEAIMAEMKS